MTHYLTTIFGYLAAVLYYLANVQGLPNTAAEWGHVLVAAAVAALGQTAADARTVRTLAFTALLTANGCTSLPSVSSVASSFTKIPTVLCQYLPYVHGGIEAKPIVALRMDVCPPTARPVLFP